MCEAFASRQRSVAATAEQIVPIDLEARRLSPDELKELATSSDFCILSGLLSNTAGFSHELFTVERLQAYENVMVDILVQDPDLVEMCPEISPKSRKRLGCFLKYVRAFKTHLEAGEGERRMRMKLALIEERVIRKMVGGGEEEGEADIAHFLPPPNQRNRKTPCSAKVQFCTNFDIGLYEECAPLIGELEKLPDWLGWGMRDAVFKHMPKGMTMGGISQPQMYIKVPGVWTGGHEENSRFHSVNINHGPGASIWAGIAPEHAQAFRALVQARFGIDIYGKEQTWFPPADFLNESGIPWFWAVQRAGDTVVLNGGTLHWVRSAGFAVNSSWNFGVRSVDQIASAYDRYEINCKLGLHNVIPLKQICMQMLVDFERSGQKVTLLHTRERDFLKYIAMRIAYEAIKDKHHAKIVRRLRLPLRPEEEGALVVTCDHCYCEILHAYIICQTCAMHNVDMGVEEDLEQASAVHFCVDCGNAHFESNLEHEFEARCKEILPGQIDFMQWSRQVCKRLRGF